jgi:hypothetical protein
VCFSSEMGGEPIEGAAVAFVERRLQFVEVAALEVQFAERQRSQHDRCDSGALSEEDRVLDLERTGNAD